MQCCMCTLIGWFATSGHIPGRTPMVVAIVPVVAVMVARSCSPSAQASEGSESVRPQAGACRAAK